jgi:hypothetical protein
MPRKTVVDLYQVELTDELWAALDEFRDELKNEERELHNAARGAFRKQATQILRNSDSFDNLVTTFEAIEERRTNIKFNPVVVTCSDDMRFMKISEGNLYIYLRWNGSKYVFDRKGRKDKP